MSKTAFPPTYRRTCFGGLCAVLIATALLPATVAAKPGYDFELRRSDRVDLRRLGKVTEDERAVLRIEWRVALASGEEAQTVRTLLDNLQRLEMNISEATRQIVAMPNRAPVATTPAPPMGSSEKNGRDTSTRLLVANIAAASLVALWLFRRRKAAVSARADRGRSTPLQPVADQSKVAANHPGEKQADQAQRVEPHLKANPGSATETNVQSSESPVSENKDTAKRPATEPGEIDSSKQAAKPNAVAPAGTTTPMPGTKIPANAPAKPMGKGDEPTLQLAEIMLSMGLDQGAAQALLEYIESNPRQAVYHWLKLLGIYRKKGMQQEFTETAGKLRQFFNIQANEWDRPSDGDERSLEKFTRVSVQVQQIWLQPDQCLSYLRHLLEDNRDGARAGFPQSVAEEILFLIEVIRASEA